MAFFTMKKGATRPVYVANLLDNFGLPTQGPLNLTNATSITLIMRLQGGTGIPMLQAPMTPVNAAQGQVQYTWVDGDTSIIGTYDVEFKIVWNDGGIEKVPNGETSPDYGTIVIKADLNES